MASSKWRENGFLRLVSCMAGEIRRKNFTVSHPVVCPGRHLCPPVIFTGRHLCPPCSVPRKTLVSTPPPPPVVLTGRHLCPPVVCPERHIYTDSFHLVFSEGQFVLFIFLLALFNRLLVRVQCTNAEKGTWLLE